MSTRVPENVMLASLVPLPAEKVSPAVPLRVSVPSATVSISCTGLLAASMSATDIRLPLAVEKISGVFVLPLCAPGTPLTGASFTAVTFTVIVLGVVSRSTPPSAVPPVSCTWNVKLA